MGVEQFGTNLRASAAISIPNMVRGSLPLLLLLFKFNRHLFQDYLTGVFCQSQQSLSQFVGNEQKNTWSGSMDNSLYQTSKCSVFYVFTIH